MYAKNSGEASESRVAVYLKIGLSSLNDWFLLSDAEDQRLFQDTARRGQE